LDEKEIARRLLRNFGIRIEPEMSAYARRQLERDASESSFAIMGAHARTGVPLRTMIDTARLRANASASDIITTIDEISRGTY
jgi:hypothetical protein